jgi:uncharacterized protein (DUF2062 family)
LKFLLHRRWIQPVVALLTQGVTVEKIALSIACGISFGIFPVLGSTSLLCAIAAALLQLNLPAIQLVNWFVYPLQLMLLVPFMRAGGVLFRSGPVSLSLAQLVAMVHAKPLQAITSLFLVSLRAISVWLLIAPLLTVLLYVGLSPVLRRLALAIPESPRSMEET